MGLKPCTPARKYHFMLGTTSRVPGAPGWHYLIIDVDSKTRMKHLFLRGILPEPNVSQETVSGVHIYTNRVLRLKQMLHIAVKWYGADRTWARLALKRGWAFLADKGEVKIPWPVERMVIGWRKPCSK